MSSYIDQPAGADPYGVTDYGDPSGGGYDSYDSYAAGSADPPRTRSAVLCWLWPPLP